MALTSGSNKDQQTSPVVSVPDGGTGLEGSQYLSTPGDSSDPARNCYSALFLTQDFET